MLTALLIASWAIRNTLAVDTMVFPSTTPTDADSESAANPIAPFARHVSQLLQGRISPPLIDFSTGISPRIPPLF